MGSWVEVLASGKWQARYTLPDGRKRSAGSFTHKAAARKAAVIAEADAASLGWRDPKAALKTWGEWCTEWWPTRGVEPGTLSRDASPRDKYLKPKWANTPLIEITRHDVKAWATSMAKEGLAPASVQRHMSIFSASLSAAVDAEIIAANPAYRISIPHGQTDVHRYLTKPEAALLLAQFAPPVKASIDLALVTLLLDTGLRWGEAIGLQVGRVDLVRGSLRVAEVWDDRGKRLKLYPKGRRIRDVPIPPRTAANLAGLIGSRRTGFVFGTPINYANWRTRTWTVAVTNARLGHVRIHDCRHTYASRLIQAGVPLAEVGRLLGHASPITTQRYAHLAETPSASILAALI